MKILHGVWPLHDGRFSKWSHFSNIWCFLERLLAQKNSKWFVKWIWTCFLEFQLLTQSEDFPWAIALAWWSHFENRLIFPIFGVFSSAFLQRTALNDFWNGFWHVFWNFNFWSRVSILHGPLHDGRFSKWSHFSNIRCFFEGFFVQNNFKRFVEWMLTVFLNFNFWPKVKILHGLHALHDGRFSKWSYFSNIWCFIEWFLAENNYKWFLEWVLTCFLEV